MAILGEGDSCAWSLQQLHWRLQRAAPTLLSGETSMPKQEFLRLPVVSASAEFLVMGYLMRRNILAYKAPQNNEGYDLHSPRPTK